MKKEEFYERVAGLLGTTYDCEAFPHAYRTRWNNRKPGGGRFEGYGIIRAFGDTVQIALYNPPITKICSSFDEALGVIEHISKTAQKFN